MEGRLIITYIIGADTYRLNMEVPGPPGAEPSLAALARATQLATRDLEEHVRRNRYPNERPRERGSKYE